MGKNIRGYILRAHLGSLRDSSLTSLKGISRQVLNNREKLDGTVVVQTFNVRMRHWHQAERLKALGRGVM